MSRDLATDMGGQVKLMQGDARHLDLPDSSVDLVITSPPYFGLRSYQDGGEHYTGQLGDEPTPSEFVDALIECTKEMVRVTKQTGSIWVNLGDKYNSAASGQNGTASTSMSGGRHDRMGGRGSTVASARSKSLIGIPWRYAIRCMDDLGLVLRAEVIWSKPNGLPESVKDRVRRSHEQWFHFTLSPRYYANVDAIREPRVSPIGDYRTAGKLPGSVRVVTAEPLRVPKELGVDHYAAFPTAWPRWIIQGWSPADGVVLDPFGGTGTTALVASVLGRTGISNDMSSDYTRIAEWRTADPKQRVKAAGLNGKQPLNVRGEPRLFDEGAA